MFVRVAMAVACAASLGAGNLAAQRIVIVSLSDSPMYRRAIAGVQQLGVAAETVASTAAAERILTEVARRAARDTVIVAMGAPAAALVSRLAPAVPVVHCMANATGESQAAAVSQEVPAQMQIAALKRLVPGVRNVGVLFDPAQNEKRADDMAAALRGAGYVPVLEPVSGPTALPGALARLAGRVDVLLGLSDTTVYVREHSHALLLFSFRQRIPLVGPNEAWVKAGALYGLEWDHADLGRYCGALALRQLSATATPAPAAPRTRLIANLRSAQQLRSDWSEDTVRGFDKVYPDAGRSK